MPSVITQESPMQTSQWQSQTSSWQQFVQGMIGRSVSPIPLTMHMTPSGMVILSRGSGGGGGFLFIVPFQHVRFGDDSLMPLMTPPDNKAILLRSSSVVGKPFKHFGGFL